MENGRGLENRDPNQNGGPPNVYNALRVTNVAGTKVNHLVGYGRASKGEQECVDTNTLGN